MLKRLAENFNNAETPEVMYVSGVPHSIFPAPILVQALPPAYTGKNP